MRNSGPMIQRRPPRWLKYASALLIAMAVAGCGGGSNGAKGDPGTPADPTVLASLQTQIDALKNAPNPNTAALAALQTQIDALKNAPNPNTAVLAAMQAQIDALTAAITPNAAAQVTALAQKTNPETCSLCHTGATPLAKSGSQHQADYNQYFQDGVVKIVTGSMAIVSNGIDTATLTFQMTKSGAPFDCTKSTASTSNFTIGSYWATYDAATKTFPDDLSLVGTKAWNSVTNVCTFTKVATTAADKAIVAKIAAAGTNGIVQIYGADEILTRDAAKHLSSGKYPFAGVLRVGAGVDYSSAANVSGCESCHTTPFLKHTYIYGTVADNTTGAATQFYTCKGCHFDQRTGGDLAWQIEKDNPARAAAIAGGSPITAAETAKYAYKAKLMNDVHMSHNMEFPYPQSMLNCSTCHAGATQLAKIFADAKFTAETCISCHSVDGIKAKMSAATYNHSTIIVDDATLKSAVCSACHNAAGNRIGPTIGTIHNGGFDPKIYTPTGVRYSDNYKIVIDSTTFANNKLDIKFHATEAAAIAGLSKNSILPTVMVGLYGYDTKDFIVAAHGTAPASAGGGRNLEFLMDGVTTNPRFAIVSSANGSWEVTADLSLWSDKITAGVIKRAEIAVLPQLKDVSRANLILGLNAPSRTFDLTKKTFDDAFFKPIIQPLVVGGVTQTKSCNSCHDQLATTFHDGIRGGSVVVCRICHEVQNGGSHLEMQSRSIDSYVHAIHSFQAFDIKNIDLTDPVAAMEYKNHIGTSYPKFGIQDCESCHVAGTYDVPDQAKSMPGLLSASSAFKVGARNMPAISAAVTGPAVRACGACHRAQLINADDGSGMAVLNSHFSTFGYWVVNMTGLWDAIVAKMMAMF